MTQDVEPRRASRWQTPLVAMVVVLGIQGALVAAYRFVERDDEHLAVASVPRNERLRDGPTLPALDLQRADGSVVPIGRAHGRPILVHFWATWCPPCRTELPGLLRLGRELDDDGGPRLIAVSLDRQWAPVASFFDGTIPREVVRDPSGRLAKRYGVSGLPDTYFVDASGRATRRFGGARRWSAPGARRLLLDLAREPQR